MWTKISNKGHQEWEKAYVEAGIPSKKLKVPVKTCVSFQSCFISRNI